MTFKEKLLRKISIDHLTKKVIESIRFQSPYNRIDLKNMKKIMEMSPFQFQRQREMNLYVLHDENQDTWVMVLDNDLPLYKTSVSDVLLRKSPTIKEMISIRNAIKILNDTDVLVSKKEKTLKTIRHETIKQLDLKATALDFDLIALDGLQAFINRDANAVLEFLSLFSEMMDYQPVPKNMQISNHKIIGELIKDTQGAKTYSQILIYNIVGNEIKIIDELIDSTSKDQIEKFHNTVLYNKDISIEGEMAFQFLKDQLKRNIESINERIVQY